MMRRGVRLPEVQRIRRRSGVIALVVEEPERKQAIKAATNRAIDAVLGKKPWPAPGEVEREFWEARRRRA